MEQLALVERGALRETARRTGSKWGCGLADNRLTVAETIYQAANIPRWGGRLFCVGANVGRINFLSQQIRALNLVWALNARGAIEPNKLVAVVGAGIAGVTAAVALRAYGCTVRVFDKGARPLHRQRGAVHRHVYPNINWWPHGDKELSVTTALPFLDWYLGQCSEVIATIEKGWNRLEEESGGDLEFIGNTEIERPEFSRAGETLTLRDTSGESHEGFHRVVVAPGFGEERNHLGLPIVSYWRPDDLESVRDGVQRKLPAIVSGFGDGGQIDALRLAYDFDFGKLSFEAAKLIQDSPLQAEMEKTEKQEVGASSYEDLARSIKQDPELAELKKLLDKALKKKSTVILVDRNFDAPFRSGAAPIHKILIAYAYICETLDYKRNTEVKKARKGRKPAYDVDKAIYEASKNHLVIRHGATPFCSETLIHPDDWAALEIRQQAAKDYSFKPAWDEDDPLAVPEGWPCPIRDVERYIESRRALANAAFHNMGSSARVVPSSDGFLVFGHEGEFKPTHLFGKPVSYPSEQQRRRGKAM